MALEPPRSTTNNFSEEFLTENIPVGWPWRLLIFAAFVFTLSILIFLGLRFGYETYLDEQSAKLDRNIDALLQSISLEERDRFVGFYSKLVNLKKVLDSHPYPSNIFKMLEENVVADVYFSDLISNTLEENAEIKGFASSFNALAQQIAALEALPEVETILVKDVSLRRGASDINFTAAIIFKKGFFSKLK